MRTFSGAMPNILAALALAPRMIWCEVHIVSLSPSQAAMVLCGSIIAWLSSGVV
jgi:hypothetical protein